MSGPSAVPHVVVLGGGFGGLSAARALAGKPVRVTLVDRHNYHLSQPLLYQVATASPVAASLGVPLDRVGRVAPEPRLAVPGRANVFVAGDLCTFEQDGRRLPGLAQVAMQVGHHAARNVLRAMTGRPLEPFRYRDYGSMAVIGRGAAVADVFGVRASGFLAWLLWIFLHLFWLVGFRNRFVVMTEWASTYITLQRRAHLITGGGLSPGTS